MLEDFFTPINRKYAQVAGSRFKVKEFGGAVGALPSISQRWVLVLPNMNIRRSAEIPEYTKSHDTCITLVHQSTAWLAVAADVPSLPDVRGF